MKRISRKAIVNTSAINATKATHATYFPFPEYTDRVAYSAGVYGWTGNQFIGLTSGIKYAVTDQGNEYAHACLPLVQAMGNREKAVIESLDHVEEIEHKDNGKYSMLRFVARDGHSFTVATFDFGHTWTICG